MLWLYHFPKSIFGFSFGTPLEEAWSKTQDTASIYSGFHQRIESPARVEDVMKGSPTYGEFSVLCAIEGTVCRFVLGFEPNSDHPAVLTTAEIESLPPLLGESDYHFGYFLTLLDCMAQPKELRTNYGRNALDYIWWISDEVEIHSWVSRIDGHYGDYLVRFTTDKSPVVAIDGLPRRRANFLPSASKHPQEPQHQ